MQTELTQALTALEAAAEAIKKLQTHQQPQQNMPYPFEVGKVYKMVNDTVYRFFFKFKSFEKLAAINYEWCITSSNLFICDSTLYMSNPTFSPADPSEYSQYLPDGHPDKIPQLSIKGAWYEVVSVGNIDIDMCVKVGDKVQCIQGNNDTPYCLLNGKETAPNGSKYTFYMHQLRHLPNYVPPVDYITDVSKLPTEIYVTYDMHDGEIFCAFFDKEQCEREAQESGCGMQRVRLVCKQSNSQRTPPTSSSSLRCGWDKLINRLTAQNKKR